MSVDITGMTRGDIERLLADPRLPTKARERLQSLHDRRSEGRRLEEDLDQMAARRNHFASASVVPLTEPGGQVNRGFRISAATWKAIADEAHWLGVSTSEFIREAALARAAACRAHRAASLRTEDE